MKGSKGKGFEKNNSDDVAECVEGPRYASRGEKIKVLFPICLFITFQQGLSQFGIILDNLASYFPDASQTMIQMVVVTPSITAVPVSLLTGVVSTIWPRKKIGMFAMVAMFVGGVLPVFLHDNIAYLFISSSMIGVSQGLIISSSTGMFAENFVGNDRDMAMGFKQVTDSIGNAIIAVLVGQLCLVAWYYSYAAYFLMIPIIILVAKYLPMGTPDQKLYSKKTGLAGLGFMKNPHFLFMCLYMAVTGFFMYSFYINGAMAVAEKGLGDAALVSIVFSITNILTLIFGLLYGPIARLLKKYSLACAMVIMSVSYVMFFFGNSSMSFLVAGVIWGIGNSLIQSSCLVFLATSLPMRSLGLGTAIGHAMVNVGIILSPIVLGFLNNTLFGSESANNALLITGVGLLLFAGIEALRELVFVKHSPVGVRIDIAENGSQR